MSRVEVVSENLMAARSAFLGVLHERFVHGLFVKFDALSPSAALAPPAVRFAMVQAAGRFLLVRIGKARCEFKVRFGTSMRPVSTPHVFIETDLPETGRYHVLGWNAFVSAVMEAAKDHISKHCDKSWGFAASHQVLWKTVQAMTGDVVLQDLRHRITSAISAESIRARFEGDECRAVKKFCEGHRDDHMNKLRKWVEGHVSTDVLTKEDFMTVYDELLVKDVIES